MGVNHTLVYLLISTSTSPLLLVLKDLGLVLRIAELKDALIDVCGLVLAASAGLLLNLLPLVAGLALHKILRVLTLPLLFDVGGLLRVVFPLLRGMIFLAQRLTTTLNDLRLPILFAFASASALCSHFSWPTVSSFYCWVS